MHALVQTLIVLPDPIKGAIFAVVPSSRASSSPRNDIVASELGQTEQLFDAGS